MAQVFAIDEAQFFPDLLEFCRWAADVEHRTVIVAGLDGDFRRKKFGQVKKAGRNSLAGSSIPLCLCRRCARVTYRLPFNKKGHS